MSKQAHPGSKQSEQVAVWTPWGIQSVPQADSRLASVRRMVRKVQEKAALQAPKVRKPALNS